MTFLWFVEMDLVQNHNHYTTAKAIYSVALEREIEGMLCSADDGRNSAVKSSHFLFSCVIWWIKPCSHGHLNPDRSHSHVIQLQLNPDSERE